LRSGPPLHQAAFDYKKLRRTTPRLDSSRSADCSRLPAIAPGRAPSKCSLSAAPDPLGTLLYEDVDAATSPGIYLMAGSSRRSGTQEQVPGPRIRGVFASQP
jgi:hypothetical protein